MLDTNLQKVKILLNIDIEDNTQNDLIEILENQAISMIQKYLNCDRMFIDEDYSDALICCIVDLYYSSQNKNGTIQSMTQGQRSISYNSTMLNTELSDRVKSMLPLPRMRLL